jgi:hypothetical protein
MYKPKPPPIFVPFSYAQTTPPPIFVPFSYVQTHAAADFRAFFVCTNPRRRFRAVLGIQTRAIADFRAFSAYGQC